MGCFIARICWIKIVSRTRICTYIHTNNLLNQVVAFYDFSALYPSKERTSIDQVTN